MTLCGNCKDADLEAAFQNDLVPVDDRVAVRQKSSSKVAWSWRVASESCDLCSMLKLLASVSRDKYWEVREDNLLFRLPENDNRPTFGFWPYATDPASPWGFVSPETSLPEDMYHYVLPTSGLINSFDRIRSLLADSTGPNHPIASIKTIDCERMCVVNHPESVPYVTLSYTWGGINDLGTIAQGDAPCVIRDAITVTGKLGYRYLWVDRYCIDQEAPEELAVQINQMDLIYQNAAVCIIAAGLGSPHFVFLEYHPPGYMMYLRTSVGISMVPKFSSYVIKMVYGVMSTVLNGPLAAGPFKNLFSRDIGYSSQTRGSSSIPTQNGIMNIMSEALIPLTG